MMNKRFFVAMMFATISLGVFSAYSQTKAVKSWEKEGEENPLRREEQLFKERAYPDGIPNGAFMRAAEKFSAMSSVGKSNARLLSAQPQWKLIGPDNIGGRTRSIVYHPTQKGTLYVGAAGGGVWKTTNSGESWMPMFDTQSSICMGAVAIDPNNPSIIYAATGEMNSQPMNPATGAGLFKSTDAGTTWKLMGLTTVQSFSKIYVHPKNSNLIYAGGVRSGQGLWKSTDAGVTWKRMNRYTVSDVTINPHNENELYLGVSSVGVVKSTDGGETWTTVSTADFPTTIGRVSVQLCEKYPEVLYCLFEGPNPEGGAANYAMVFKSTNAGAKWNQVYTGTLFAVGDSPQGWYDNYIMVDPKDSTIAFAGGIDVIRTTNGGKFWQNVTNSYGGGNVHPDQHAGTFNPNDSKEVWIANDGGVYLSTNGGTTFEERNNGYAVTQFYAMGIDQSRENRTYGGSQDNGTSGSLDGSPSWGMVGGGDGFFVEAQADNPNTVYWETYNGIVRKTDVETGSTVLFTTGIAADDEGAWSSPIAQDPVNKMLFHGRRSVYAMEFGASAWTTYSIPRFDTTISAIGICSKNPAITWCGTSNGNVYRTTEEGDNWKNVSFNGLPRRLVRDIMCSRKDENIAWVCYSGYGTGHVYKTTNLGASWTDISTTLPDVPVNAIIVHPTNENIIFAGTDVGVFATFNGGESWLPYGAGLPRTPILDLAYHETKNMLRCATHGRSMWEVPVDASVPDAPEITAPTGGEVVMATAPMIFSWHGFTGPVTIDVSFSDGQYWGTLATNVVGTSFRYIVENRPTQFARIRVTSVSNPSQSVVSRPFTILEFQKGSVQKSGSVAHVAYGLAFDGNNGLWTTSFYTNKLYKLNANTLAIEKEFTMPAGHDKNFTDMTIDRTTQTLFVNRLLHTGSNPGARVVVLDTNGTLIRVMNSPSSAYAIGLELVNGKMIIGERDGNQMLYTCNPADLTVEKFVVNPYRVNAGPRCLAYDGKDTIYQVCTDFSAGFQGATLQRIHKDRLTKAIDTLDLFTSAGVQINARGVEIDTRDGNYWITDLDGNIYKIANFNTPSNPLSSVNDATSVAGSGIVVSPNPAADNVLFSFMTGEVSAHVRVDVYSLTGEKITTLFDGTAHTDEGNTLRFDSSSLPSGMYAAVLTINGVSRPAQKFVIAH